MQFCVDRQCRPADGREHRPDDDRGERRAAPPSTIEPRASNGSDARPIRPRNDSRHTLEHGPQEEFGGGFHGAVEQERDRVAVSRALARIDSRTAAGGPGRRRLHADMVVERPAEGGQQSPAKRFEAAPLLIEALSLRSSGLGMNEIGERVAVGRNRREESRKKEEAHETTKRPQSPR